LLTRLKEHGARFTTMGEAAAKYGCNAPDYTMSMGEIPGRAGKVAIQGKLVSAPKN
jgi:hypothetical protein